MEALPAIAVALAAVSTGVGVAAAVEQGKAAEAAGKRQQQLADANAKAAADAARLESAQIRRKNLIRLGAQRAAAGSGLSISDSAADVIYDTSIQGELEALSSTYSGSSSASAYRYRGRAAAAEGSAAATGSYLSAAGILIKGTGSSVKSAEPYF